MQIWKICGACNRVVCVRVNGKAIILSVDILQIVKFRRVSFPTSCMCRTTPLRSVLLTAVSSSRSGCSVEPMRSRHLLTQSHRTSFIARWVLKPCLDAVSIVYIADICLYEYWVFHSFDHSSGGLIAELTKCYWFDLGGECAPVLWMAKWTSLCSSISLAE